MSMWHDDLPVDCPEDCTVYREAGETIRAAYDLGYAAAKQEEG
jgi:hypothetical protein